MDFTKIGQIKLDDKVDITDPCYNRSVRCRLNDVPVVPGTYNCYISVSKEYSNLCAAIAIVREEEDNLFENGYLYSNNNFSYKNEARKGAKEIGVDAGLAGFFKAPKPDYDDDGWDKFCNQLYVRDNQKPLRMTTDNSFVASSGYGDGSYPVYLRKIGNKNDEDNKEYNVLVIVFIGEEE